MWRQKENKEKLLLLVQNKALNRDWASGVMQQEVRRAVIKIKEIGNKLIV